MSDSMEAMSNAGEGNERMTWTRTIFGSDVRF